VRWLALLLVLGCKPNPDFRVDQCIPQGKCGAGNYSLCYHGTCTTHYSAGGSTFDCASCTSCQLALSQVLLFCGGGGTTGGGDSTCTTQAHTACVNCCINNHSAGYDRYLTLLANCECVSPGACKTDCTTSFCVDRNQTDTLCNVCIQANSGSGGVCDVTSSCNLNGDCAALLACATACPP
jgi:hypothetical protein